MKTDELFYELFKLDPHSLFRLVQLDLEGEYTFESLTVKTTEKRFDGFCRRIDGQGPNIFLEIQGYRDPNIYWRTFREICTYYEQTGSMAPFVAIVLFLDVKYDPGSLPLSGTPPNQVIRANLQDCLASIWNQAGILTVLKPYVIAHKQELFQHIQQWQEDLYALQLPEYALKTLIGLLEYLILQRFPEITRKELERMLQFMPLEKTAAGQEVYQMGLKAGLKEGLKEGFEEGRKDGQKDGIEKGELIGEIRLAQRLLKREPALVAELAEKSLQELQELFQSLETELANSR